MSVVEYIAVQPQIVGNPQTWATAYYSDCVRHCNRKAAIAHGLAQNGHDDFLIVTVRGHAVVDVGWMEKDRSDPDEIAEVAREFGWTVTS
jgi:hypothetical protein